MKLERSENFQKSFLTIEKEKWKKFKKVLKMQVKM